MKEPQVVLQEQVIEDKASGLTLTVWRTVDGEGRIRITGDLPYGNRDLCFDTSGQWVGAGTALVDACPVPLRLVN